MAKIYEKLWKSIGGRPWTYILRDAYHGGAYVVVVGCFSLGYAIRPHLALEHFWLVIAVFTIGFIAGHLFWGTPWKRGQKGC